MYNVSMKSGLEGRNNRPDPGRHGAALDVSMKSDLEGRNNRTAPSATRWACTSLNEVRPRRPEQSSSRLSRQRWCRGLNEVRPRRPEQSEKKSNQPPAGGKVSMKSGLEGRNNDVDPPTLEALLRSQ